MMSEEGTELPFPPPGGGDDDGWMDETEEPDEEEGLSWLAAYSDDFLVDMGAHSESRGGRVYLVGAGPGDPSLLTVRARVLLDVCDVIVHDAGVSPAILARRDPSRAPAELHPAADDEETAALLVRLAREGRRVVRLTTGDPFVLARGGAEGESLAEAGVDFEVVPGVLPELAAGAHAGVPLTHQGLSAAVTLVDYDAASDPSAGVAWDSIARSGGTIVVRVRRSRLPTAAATLLSAGAPAELPAVVVGRGALAGEPTLTTVLEELAHAAGEHSDDLVTLIAGWTVVLRDELAWLEGLPLHGRRVLLGGTTRWPQLAAMLREEGAIVSELPEALPEPLDSTQVHETMQWLAQYDWLVFADAEAARLFWKELRATGRDARSLGGCRLAAGGSAAAAALLTHGLAADLVAEGVAELLEGLVGDGDVPLERVLWLGAESGLGGELLEGIEATGAMVEALPLYRRVLTLDEPASHAALVGPHGPGGGVEAAILTEESTIPAFIALVGRGAERAIPIVVPDAAVADRARRSGLDGVEESPSPSPRSLISTLVGLLADA